VIAAGLHISEQTVKTHMSNLLAKLQVEDRTQAAVRALRSRLVPLDDAGGD
jgi:DNA-binding NarL/FixJ family response regulator